jgi:hypothetical protein
MSSWHGFEPGSEYALEEVVSKGDRHINDGQVKAIGEKRNYFVSSQIAAI